MKVLSLTATAAASSLIMALVLYHLIHDGYCYWPSSSLASAVRDGGDGNHGKVNRFLKFYFKDLIMTPAANKHHQRQLSYSENVYINKTTSHTTVTVSLISTTTVSTSQFCARFVGVVAGGCRRRRRRRIISQLDNVPLLPDADTDNDDEMAPIQPDKMMLNRQDTTQLVSSATPSAADDDSYHPPGRNWRSYEDVVQPSMISTASSERMMRNVTDPADDESPSSSYYSPSTGRIFGSFYYFFYSPVYLYVVSTSTSFVYTTTKTFFISLCVPSSFSYPIC